jgi:ABC-type polar amino acid transport system ATPase subunit
MIQKYELRDVLIKIQDLGLKFGDKVVLSGINAEVRDIVRPGVITGQVVGILGPSGIGKTQLSRVLTGLQDPSAGTVTVGTEHSPIHAGLVGFVAQNYPLLRHRTVLGNLEVAARSTHVDDKTAAAKSMEFLQRFDLSDKWDQYPAELSGGQRQRVAIAQQLLCSEHYLILDEPTTGLDPIMKDKVVELIRQVASLSEENTIFIVTHDIPAVMSVADHLWLLGRVKDEKGEFLGASIVHQYDLMERGITWDPNPSLLPAFTDLLREVRSKFEGLSAGIQKSSSGSSGSISSSS